MTSPLWLWVDLETTHLDLNVGQILEIAAVITDSDLNPVAHFHEVVRPPHFFNPMTDNRVSEWCRDMHSRGRPSLWQRVMNPKTSTVRVAATRFGAFLDEHRDGKRMMVAGSSVHFDLQYMNAQMPNIQSRLHYRTIDVSTLLVLARRWRPDLLDGLPHRSESHRAMDDVLASIELLKSFKQSLFMSGSGSSSSSGAGAEDGQPKIKAQHT